MQRIIKTILLVLFFIWGINCINGSKNSLPFFAYLDLSTKGGNSFAIAQITPGSGVSDIPLNTSIQATFNSAFDSSSVTSSTFFLKKGGDPILATLRLDKNTAVLTPNSALSASTTYSVTISKEIKSEEGISLKEDLTWNFTTATIIDAVAPALSLRIPAAGAALISNTTSVQVAFTETMDCTTIDNVSLILKNNATNLVELSGVNCLGSSATLSPNNPLTPNTTYRVEVSASMKDLANNPLPGPQNWTFTTGAGPDNTPPALSFASPSPGETGISVNSAIGVAFDEPIHCGSVPGNFVLEETLVPGNNVGVTLTCSGATASITPVAAAGLDFNKSYKAILTAGITDLSSNPITPRTWTFTTGAAPDLTQPTVTFTFPAVNATGVGVNINPTVVFSEPMACGTVNAASFRLKQQATGVYLVGNVACFGTSATWTPDPVNPFAFNTTYTVEINAGARDSANLPAIPFSWNFTTGPGPDLTAPSVAFVAPTNGSAGLPINSGGSIAFDETMNCGTVLGSISMDDDITTPLSVVDLNINCNGNTATFAPTGPLAFNTTYTVTVAPTATDASGNLIGTYSWSFTTGAAPDVTPPQISLVSPLPGATGISTNSNITVSFNETINCSTLNLTVNNGISLTKNCSGASATFTPTVPTPFNAGTNYAVTLATVKDLQGNTILPDPSLTWNFTTGLAPDVTPPTIAIQNLRTNSTIESGFVIGTAADARGIASIEISIDGGGFTGAGIIGTTSWKYPLPTGVATWRSNSQHTIQVKATDTSNNVTTSAMITVRKGTNKDINGDGYSDLVTAEYGQGLVYIFHSSGAAGITTTSAPFASRTIVGNAAIRFGKTVATGDVNGDGFADVIVGAPTDVVGGAPVGRVYIFHSSGTNGVIASFSGFANNTLTGNLNADRFGDALATGDINGDGYTDVIVGAPGYNTSTGRIYVFHSTGGAGITTVTVNGAGAGASSFKTGSATGDRFGYFISTGNMNGNTGGGFSDDIAVGAPGWNNGFGDDWGRVYIYYGSTPGGLTAAAPNTITNNTADTNNVAGFPGGPALFGASVSVADIDGDGFCDVVVGAPLFTQASVLPAGSSPLQGRVAVFLAGAGIGGIANTTVGAANRAINGIVNGQTIGMSLTVKDLDSDGRADIILTSVNPNAVQVFMTPTVGGIGPVSADTNTASVTIAGVPGLGFSGSFAGAPGVPSPSSSLSNGDINGDGLIDLIIGGTNNAVRVFHSVGGATPVTNNPAAASSIILDSGLVGGIGGVGANSNEFGAGLY
ncbi:Ig-like protein [Leptospira kirschneri str. MMD1493]|uniref:Ig-like domain-containing protein n=1 Tax=Leptospira kirschneri TaxID=29507 RepID=UPI0002C038C3|nr:Ig-like domain-containing protein [Leptospira kirschneri]EMK03207.1 Ig-like protein [Leptospira kirschneri str. MMD1493]